MNFSDCLIHLREGAALLILYAIWQALYIMLGEANVLAFGLFSLTNIQFKGSNCQSQKFTTVRIILKELFTPNESLVQMLQE